MAKKYRDSLFRNYFSDKVRLLSLCNLLTGVDGNDPDEIVINTLDGTFFEELKNDISCIYRDKFLVIIEHQSTLNENMPLRILFYAAELFKQYVKVGKFNIYTGKKIALPKPEFFVLYNGNKPAEAFKTMRLSDSFVSPSEFLEVVVKHYNINSGMNDDFVRRCDYLNHYCIFVNRVKANMAAGLDINHAIAESFRYCQSHNVMADYLEPHKKELVSMLGFEYNRADAEQAWKEYGIELGREEGLAIGLAEGRAKGIEIGRAEGIAEGRAEGIATGRAEGIAAGRAEGIATGRAEGIAAGRAEGIVTGRAEGIAAGRAEGIATGRAEGIATGLLTAAKNLIAMNMSVDQIIQATGLTETEILKLKHS